MEIRTGSFCERGLLRTENEDAIFLDADRKAGRVIAVVADGMGGYSNGGKASAVICETVQDWWEWFCNSGGEKFSEAVRDLKEILRFANQKIRDEISNGQICGSTVVVLWIERSRWALLTAGDSRCYLLQKKLFRFQMIQITADDLWECQETVRRTYSRRELTEHPNYGRLVKAVGTETVFTCNVQTGYLLPRVVFVLCSDGVYRYCEKKLFQRAFDNVMKEKSIEESLKTVRQEIYRQGAPDNCSLVVIHIQEIEAGKEDILC